MAKKLVAAGREGDGLGQSPGAIVVERDTVSPILIVDAIDPAEAAIAAPSGRQALCLNGETPALVAILLALDRNAGVRELHIICRGEPGTLDLGGPPLSTPNLATDAATRRTLRAIGRRLGPEGAVVLGGANVGWGERGATLLQTLADLTGVEISALVRCRPDQKQKVVAGA